MSPAEDLVNAALDEKPLEFADAFSGAMMARIAELVNDRKQELAQSFLGVEPPREPEEEAPEVEEDDDEEERTFEDPTEEETETEE